VVVNVGLRGMTAEQDINRAAELMIDQHGDDAGDFALKRSEQLFDEGDAEGAATSRLGRCGPIGGSAGPDEPAPAIDRTIRLLARLPRVSRFELPHEHPSGKGGVREHKLASHRVSSWN
jgi:hypothetical protein